MAKTRNIGAPVILDNSKVGSLSKKRNIGEAVILQNQTQEDLLKQAKFEAIAGKVVNGKIDLNPVAQAHGWKSEKERKDFQAENPNTYAVMGGYKYEPQAASKYHTPLTEEGKKVFEEAKKADEYYRGDVSLDELKSHLSDEDPIAYTSPDGKNVTWQKLYDDKKYEQDLNAMYNKYSALPDWEEKSKYYQNNTKKTAADVSSFFDKNIDWQYEHTANYFPMPNKEDKYYSLQMTDKEKEVFNYIYHTQGEDAAYEWHASIVDILKERANEKYVETVTKFAEKAPVLSDAASVLANTFAGAEYIGNFLADNGVEKSKLATFSQTVRSTRAEQVNWEIGNWDAFDFIYNTGMSLADSTASAVAFGKTGGVALGISAAAQGVNDALDRGLSGKQAFWNGLASGTFEMIFETISIGQFSALKESLGSGIKNIAKNIGKSMLVNASEETLTEIANIVYDTVMNTDFSDYETKIRAYVASGMTPEEAEKQVKNEMTRQVAEAAASGALMGFGFGGIGSVSSHINAKAIESAYSKADINSLINTGLSAPDSKAYALAQQYQAKINSGKSLSAQEIVDLQQAVTEAVSDADISKIKQAVEARLIELGEGKAASAVADIIAKQVEGQKLTSSEKSALKNSKYGQRVANEITPENIASGEYASEWVKNIGTDIINRNVYNRNLQSTAEGVVDSDYNLNYNDNSIKEGESYADDYQRTMGSFGRETRDDDTRGRSGKTKENAKITREVGVAFQRRTKETYGDARRLAFYLNTTVAYKVADVIDSKSSAGMAYNILKSKGYNVVCCDGVFELNNGIKTIEVSEAITLSDGTIYISSEADLNGKGIALHEVVHVWQYDDGKEYVEYEDILSEEIDRTSKWYEKLAEEINVSHYGGKFDVEDISSFKYIIKELAAYINQYVNIDIDYARNRFGGAFRNFENVVQAVYNMNDKLGFGDIIREATSKTQVASFNSEEKQVSEIDVDKFIQGLRGVDVAHGGDTSLQKGVSASNSFELTEPTQKDIARAPSAQEAIEEAISGKQKTNIQRHIVDICKKLDSNVTVEFVDGLEVNGKFIRSQNKILIRSDLNAVQMYIEVFKHEFMHRLETKQLYSKFFNYCFKKSKAFEQYVRAELKSAGMDYDVDTVTREGVLQDYTKYKFNEYKNDKDIPQKERDAFTMENAQEEIIADFFAQILFQGKKYRERIVSALENADGEALIGIGDEISSEAALMELQEKEPTLFKQVVQWFKDVINKLRGLPQAKSLVEQLDNEINQLESMAHRVYWSKDSKLISESEFVQEKYSVKNTQLNSNKYWYPNMTKAEIELVKRIAKREINTTDNYIDNKNKWLYNKFGDKTYFALYSTEDTNEPTVLYACKGDRAEFEYEFLLIDILGREDIDEYTNKQTEAVERLSINNKYDKSDDSSNSHRSMGRGSDTGDAGLYIRNTRRRPSEALRDCLRNIREIQERDGRGLGRRLNNSQYSLGSPILQMRYSEFNLNEPNIEDIEISEETKFLDGLSGENLNKTQLHIVDICKKLFPNITVEFVDGLKTNGKFIRSQNKILIRSDLSAVQMYVEVFKHEFMHRLETKQLYSKFFNFCFKKSIAFEQYVRTELKTAGVHIDAATREGVLEAYTNYKYEQYKNSRDIPKVDRDAFTKENAREEIIADFFAQILFQGKKYRERIISALENADGEALIGIGDEISSEAALMELQQKEPTLFEQVVQWFKDVINKLRGLPQAKSLVEQLDNEINQLESMARRAYQSKDSKQLMKKKLAENGVKYNVTREDVRSWNIDWDSNNESSLKEQLRQHLEEVNTMDPVADVIYSKQSKKPYYQVLDELLRDKFGYKIQRKEYGTILFDSDAIEDARNYINNDAEAAALIAAPYVLKRGKAISGHKNHKGKGNVTVTFAAPVVLNEKVGNVAVSVMYGKGRVHSLRVLTQEGTTFELLKIKDTESTITGRSQSATVEPYIDSVSNNNIPNSDEKVKQKDIFGFKINENADINEDLLEEVSYYHPDAEVDEEGNITVYHRTTKENADKIKQTGIMTAKEDALFFSSKESGYASGYGDTVVKLKIPSTELRLNDIFDGEVHFDLPLKYKNGGYRLDVSKYLTESNGNSNDSATGQSSIGSPMQQMRYNPEAYAKYILRRYGSKADINSLINTGLSAPDSKAYALAQQYQTKIDSGKSLSAQEIVDLQQAVTQVVSDADISKIKQAVETRLIELGEGKAASAVADIIAKQVVGQKLTSSEKSTLKNSKYGQRVVNEIAPENVASGEYASEWAKSIGTNWINKNIYNMNLQSTADGVVDSDYNLNYNDNSIKEGESYGKEQLRDSGTRGQLAGENTQSGIGSVQETSKGIYRDNRESGIEPNTIYNQGNNRGIELSDEQVEGLKSTAINNEDGTPKRVYHFTNNMDFEVFAKGDIGFHFGNELQARQRGKNLKQQGRIITAYLDIKNPIYINTDLMSWYPAHIAVKLYADGIITYNQYKNILGLHIESGYEYNSPAAVSLRKILADLGCDGIIYENHYEGEGQSYIAFYPEQVIVIDDGKFYKNQAISENGVAFSSAIKDESSGGSEQLGGVPASVSASGTLGGDSAFELTEPTQKDIARAPSNAEVIDQVISGKQLNNVQRHVVDVAGRLDSGVKVEFVKGLKQNGRYIRNQNLLRINADLSTAQMYVQIFKHEFMHHLETKQLYGSFSKYCSNKSKAFEQYARASLKLINNTENKYYSGSVGNISRDGVVNTLADYYYDQYKNDTSIGKAERDAFTHENARQEMVADFFAEVLFQGESYRKRIAAALTTEGMLPEGDVQSSEAALLEMKQKEPNLFKRLVEWLKGLTQKLRDLSQSKHLVDDIEKTIDYLENDIAKLEWKAARVYLSKDSKKLVQHKFSEEKYSIKNTQSSSTRYWYPNMTKKEIDLVKQIAKRELNATDNYIDNENKWLYNKFGDKTYFALYSTAHTEEPTVLYACKGERAEFEYWYLIKYFEKEVENNGNIHSKSRIINRIFMASENATGTGNAHSRNTMGRRGNSGNAELYSNNSRRRPSEALLDCLRNISKAQERDGRINNSNDNPQFAVTSQMQQLSYNPEAYAKYDLDLSEPAVADITRAPTAEESIAAAISGEDRNSATEQGEVLQSGVGNTVDSENDLNYNESGIKEGESYGKEQLRDSGTRGQLAGENTQSGAGRLQKDDGRVFGTGQENLKQQQRMSLIRNQGDNRGIELSDEQVESLKSTAINNEDGTPKRVYHFTNNMDFEVFAKGDIGFHFGNESQARQRGKNLKQQGRIITAFLDIKNPIYINTDLMSWRPAHVAIKLYADGIISNEQYLLIREMHIESGYEYDSPAAVNLRKILADLGYDGIIYENHYEGDGQSYIAFYPEQIIIIDDGKTHTNKAISENEVAFLNLKEKQADGMVDSGSVAEVGTVQNNPDRTVPGVVEGADGRQYFDDGSGDEYFGDVAGVDVAHGGDASFQEGTTASGNFDLSEPTQKDIARAPSNAEVIEQVISGKQLNNVQRHVVDVAGKMDLGVKVEFVKGLKQNGRYIRSQNLLRINADLSTAQMYVQIFKHEFMHHLETKQLYGNFSKYCFNKSKAFEQYARACLKLIDNTENKYYSGSVGNISRDGVVNTLADYYYDQYKNDTSIGKAERDAFTHENARQEMVADFFAEVLFQGENYRKRIAAALTTEGMLPEGDVQSSEAALLEMKQKEPNLFKRLVEWLKGLTQKLRDLKQSKHLVDDIEKTIAYLENDIVRLEQKAARVYQSKDSKKTLQNAQGDKYSVGGVKSKTHSHSLLEQAIRLDDIGKMSSEEIRQQTGWYRGYDGKWRYEINDRDMEIDTRGKFHANPDIRRYTELVDKVYFGNTASDAEVQELNILQKNLEGVSVEPKTLGELIKHDKLFSAYPQLKNVPIRFENINEIGRGIYNPVFKEIILDKRLKLDKNKLSKTLIHEIQHAIQDIEGFAGGSNTEYWRDIVGIPEEKISEYYEKTAGEVEARDVANRRNLTAEQRKNTRPDIDRQDVVFASSSEASWQSAKDAKYDSEIASISQQIKNSQAILNKMDVVGEAAVPEKIKSKYDAAQWAISQLKSFGYQVDRQNFGKIYFDEKDIRHGAEYADTFAEKGAFVLIPKVLKRGVEIGRHGDHKLRQKATVTFAAPVILNGIRGNMAVVVNLNGNRYLVHRIILPDGTVFKFSEKNKEVRQESYQGVTENSSLADTTSLTSKSIISNPEENVNTEKSNDTPSGQYSLGSPMQQLRYNPEAYAKYDLDLSEPAVGDITRAPTTEESIAAAISGEQLDTKQRRIFDFAEQHFPDINVKFSGNMTKNGLWDGDSKTLLLNTNQTVAGMYIEVFKHEFMHTLESKRLYQEFKQFLFNKDTAFGVWAKVQCKTHDIELSQNATAKDAINALTDYYYSSVKNDMSIAKKYRDAFTVDGAQREMVADFFGEIMFNGKKYRTQTAQALADQTFLTLFDDNEIAEFEANSMAALAEISKHKPNIFKQIVDWVKRIILKLRGTRIRADRLLADELERNIKTLEDYVKQVYNSHETKKAAENSGGVSYAMNVVNITKTDIEHNIEEITKMKSVSTLTGREFAKGEKNLLTQVDEYFSKFGYSVENDVIGDVDITVRGAKDSIAHGIGRNKAIAFSAVPDVIKKGKIIDYQKNWKGRQYDTIVLAAPITIENTPYYEGVIILRDNKTQRFYLHEVITEKRTDMPFKTGADNKVGNSGGISSPSIISLLEKLRIVKESFTNKSVEGKNISNSDEIVMTEKSNDNGNQNPSFAVTSQMQQMRYNPEAYAKYILRRYGSKADSAEVATLVRQDSEYDVSLCFVRCDDENIISKADELERQGKSREYIRNELGVVRDGFGEWKKYLDINKCKLFANATAKTEGHTRKPGFKLDGYSWEGVLSDFVIWDEFFELFPEYKNLRVVVRSMPSDYDKVRFNPKAKTLYMDKVLCREYTNGESKILKSYMMRELQRIIQYEEGRYIGYSIEHWQELEKRGKLPFSEKFNRYLTAEDMMKYFEDNYETELMFKKQEFKHYVSQNRKYKSVNDMMMYYPVVDPEEVIVYDDNGRLVTLKEKQNKKEKRRFSADKGDRVVLMTEEEAARRAEQEQSDRLVAQGALNEIAEKGDNTLKLREYVASKEKSHVKKQRIRNDYRIKGGNSGFAEKNSEAREVLDEDYSFMLQSAFASVPTADHDTVGRYIGINNQELLEDSVCKNEKGEPISLYFMNLYGDNLSEQIRCGLALGTVDMAVAQYDEYRATHKRVQTAICTEVYAVIKRPVCLPFDPQGLPYSEICDWLVNQDKITPAQHNRVVTLKSALKPYDYSNYATQALLDVLRQRGYDGIIYNNTEFAEGSKTVVPFYEHQLIPVAYDGILVQDDIIYDDAQDEAVNLSVTDAAENTEKMKRYVTEPKYQNAKKRRLADERIKMGDAGCFEGIETTDAYSAHEKINRELKNNSAKELSGYDTAGHRLTNMAIKNFENSVFRNSKGNILLFSTWNMNSLDVGKAADEGREFVGFDAALEEFFEHKISTKNSYHGVIEQFALNCVKPLVVRQNGWNTQKMAAELLEDGIITQQFYDSIMSLHSTGSGEYVSLASTKLINKIIRKGCDCIVFVKDNGRHSVVPFFAESIIPISKNGILNENSDVVLLSEADRDAAEKANGVVLDPKDRKERDFWELRHKILSIKDKTQKMKRLTESLKYNTAPVWEDAEEVNVGYSGEFERGTVNIWNAKNRFERLIAEQTDVFISDVDTANRPLSSNIQSALANSELRDKNGRPLSFFIYAKQAQSGFERDTRGYRVSTLTAAHDEYVEISKQQPHRRKQIYNEYLVVAENPYFMMSVPKEFSAREFADSLYASGILDRYEYNRILTKSGIDEPGYKGIAAKHINRALQEQGIDSIVYMNGTYDRGSMGVMVLDESQLIFVSQNGVPNESFVKNARENEIDRLVNNGYNEIKKAKCRNERLEDEEHIVTNVPFIKKLVEIDGKMVEVVVPEFDSLFDAQLPEESYEVSDRIQFKECYSQLKVALKNNIELRKCFTAEEIERLEKGEKLNGYTWHHDVVAGRMQLVNRYIHEKTGHTGGQYFWGGGTKNR